MRQADTSKRGHLHSNSYHYGNDRNEILMKGKHFAAYKVSEVKASAS